MRLFIPTVSELECAVEKIYNDGFNRYVSPSEYEKLKYKGYNFEDWSFGKGSENTKEKIRELLIKDHFVRGGYMATSIREYHDRYIIWKP